MKCFTISSGTVTAGIAVEKMNLTGAGVEIDAVMVGESGRGRELGVLPVGGHPEAPMVPCGSQTDAPEHRGEKRAERPLLLAADVGQTRAGKPKLVREASQAKADDFCVVAFRTSIGFRGGNAHTGDRVTSPCRHRGQNPAEGLKIIARCCEQCGVALPEPPVFKHGDEIPPYSRIGDSDWRQVRHPDAGDEWTFAPFPGEIICWGAIAQGGAGGMGSGEQIVAVIPRGVVFRTGYSGRLYGRPGAHYYVFDGEKILAATWDERQASDCF